MSSSAFSSKSLGWKSSPKGEFKLIPIVKPSTDTRRGSKWAYECDFVGRRSWKGTITSTGFEEIFNTIKSTMNDAATKFTDVESDYQKKKIESRMDAQRKWEDEIRSILETLKDEYKHFNFDAAWMCNGEAETAEWIDSELL